MVLIDYWVKSLKEQMQKQFQQSTPELASSKPKPTEALSEPRPERAHFKDRAARILAFQEKIVIHKKRLDSIQSSYLSASEKAQQHSAVCFDNKNRKDRAV